MPTQVIGVPRPDLVDTFAQVAAALGTERTVVVHGAGGIDELSPAGVSLMAIVEGDEIRKQPVAPAQLGFAKSEAEALRGGNAVDNAATIRAVYAGARGPKRDAVVLNAAAGARRLRQGRRPGGRRRGGRCGARCRRRRGRR